ncbi:hypothetical protein CWI37_2739p0010 [Hamiltosporidium tvaerminnensis]|uniref:Uncharacterized protein n=1 Tax=Hamiltosporidium tvaerminnensis TaxID=1176355 RepID=A0A4Q9KQH6_9MICR|nr:hypothetical protein CWI37_2739p0010 [Hamiltosporidium tvaerminnensis]
MTNRNCKYTERVQLESRTHLGKLEKRKDALLRLKEIKEYQENIQKVKNNIQEKTGNEYFHDISKYKFENGNFIKVSIDLNVLKKNLLLINNEITRAEKKIKKYIVKPSGKHIYFDKQVSSDCKLTETIDFDKNNNILKKYTNYIQKLRNTRNEILQKIENCKNK